MNTLDFKTAFNYPFNRPVGMLNILWFFLPILGWLALGGYTVRIVQEFTKGKYKQLPQLKFGSDMSLGFFMFLKSLPFMAIYMAIMLVLAISHPWLRIGFQLLISLFILPILTINFLKKETVGSYFEFNILKSVFDNLGDYVLVILKSILLGIIFLVMWVILVGIPAGSFTQNMFLADFYRRNVK